MRAALLLVTLLVAHHGALAQKGEKGSSLLWEISGNGLAEPSYLYGTMHIRDARVFDFADSVLIDFRRCSVLAEEMMLDSVTYWLFNHLDGDSAYDLRSSLTPRQYRELDSAMQLRWSVSLDRYPHARPWVLYALNSRPSGLHNDEPTFLDAHLLHLAKLEGMKLYGLESPEEQGALFDHADAGDVAKFFGFTAGADENNEKGLQLYLTGDVERIREVAGTLIPPHFDELFLTRRNLYMAERIDALARRAGTFVAVGAAHLGGSRGLIALLRERGFTLRPVISARTGLAGRYTPPKREIPWITHVDSLYLYTLDMPVPALNIPSKYADGLRAQFLVAIDGGTGIKYGISTLVPLLQREIDPATFADLLIKSGMFSHHAGDTVETKTVRRGSLDGFEATFASGQSSWCRLRILQHNGRVFCLYAMLDRRWKDQPDVDRFFSTLRFLDTAAREMPRLGDTTITVHSRIGAYAISMPADTHAIAFRVSDGRGDSVDLHFITASALNGNIELTVGHVDAGSTLEIVFDSLSIATRLANMVRSLGGTIERDSVFLLEGFPAHEIFGVDKRGFHYRARAVIRGNRTYVLTAINHGVADQLISDHFVQSFRFAPGRSSTWRMVPADSIPCIVSMPGSVQVVMAPPYDDESRRLWTCEGTQYARDPGSAILYRVAYWRLSDRFRADDTAALFREIDDRFAICGDSVLLCRNVTIGADPAQELLTWRGNRDLQRRELVVLHGRDLFVLSALVYYTELHDADLDAFFASFHATGSDTSLESLFTSDLPNVLADIDSGDSTRRDDGLRRLWNFDFGRRDLPVVYEALRHPRPDDSLEYGSVRESLIRIVRYYSDSLTVGNLVSLLPTLDSFPALRTEVLHGIAMTARDEGRDSLLAVLRRRPELVVNWRATTLFDGVRMPVVKRWIPSLIVLGEDDRTARVLLNAATAVLDKDSLALDPMLPKIRSIARRLIAPASRHDSASDLSAYVLAGLAKSLPPGRDNDSLLQALSEMEDLSVATLAALTLIHHGVEVPGSTRERIAADPYWRLKLYYGVDSAHRAAQIPQRYRTQRAFVESFIYDYLSDDDISVDSAVFVADRETPMSAGRRRFYLFRVHADSAWRPLVVGPVSLDRSDLHTNEATYWMGDEGFDARGSAKYFDVGIDDIRKSIARTKDDESGDEQDREDE